MRGHWNSGGPAVRHLFKIMIPFSASSAFAAVKKSAASLHGPRRLSPLRRLPVQGDAAPANFERSFPALASAISRVIWVRSFATLSG